MSSIYDLAFVVFYQPLLNLLVFFYNVIPGKDVGLAIIAVTVFIKLILYPFSRKSLQSQKALQDLQPKVEALKVKYKDQKETLGIEMMKLYKAEKVNPFSSCLPLLVQFPFLIALFYVLQVGLSDDSLTNLYSFINNPGSLNAIAFGLIDLSKPFIPLAVLAGGAQFIQVRMMTTRQSPLKVAGSKDENMLAMMNKQMMFIMPIMTIIIGSTLPGGLSLYWLVTTILTVGQQYITFRGSKGASVVTDVSTG
jgi:YidC/Oxa1 family membrane protein insertase